MSKFLAILGTILLLGSTADAQQQRNERPRSPHITVSGDAVISAEPDQAEIDIGVVTQSRTAPEASKENAERLARVLAEVKKQIGKGDEVKTSGYSLAPTYRYPQGGKPEIVGYTASNTLRIKTTNLNLVGRLIDSAMQAGANNVQRLVFTLKDELSAQLEALKTASAKARAKAEATAASLGLKVVRIIAVNEGERVVQPVFRRAMTARAEAASAPTPIESGTVEIRSTVSLTVEVSEK
jgi:uncharacterized protein YggE